MRFKTVLFFLVASLALPALGDEPKAVVSQPYAPRLGDIMGQTQLRHMKLWYAGSEKNWALANYELGQIKESFTEAMTYYPGIPASDMTTMNKPAAAIDAAIKAKDSAQFASGYRALTAACNACHKEQSVGYIVIRVPVSSPFSDQLFPPQ